MNRYVFISNYKRKDIDWVLLQNFDALAQHFIKLHFPLQEKKKQMIDPILKRGVTNAV